MMSCGGLPKRRHQDKDSEDDENNDDVEDLFTIEETEESDEVETSETAESDEQTDDSEAVVGVEMIDKELLEASDEGMDDDEMFRMDTYLERILKEHKNQAGGETAHS
ncbi:hypothetical protein ACSBR2_018961 [Camellia fascicularis]